MEKLWKVILYNDQAHSFNDVILALISIGLPPLEALYMVEKIHSSKTGCQVVSVAPLEQAQLFAEKIRRFGLLVELDDTEDELLRKVQEKLEEMEEGEEWKTGKESF